MSINVPPTYIPFLPQFLPDLIIWIEYPYFKDPSTAVRGISNLLTRARPGIPPFSFPDALFFAAWVLRFLFAILFCRCPGVRGILCLRIITGGFLGCWDFLWLIHPPSGVSPKTLNHACMAFGAYFSALVHRSIAWETGCSFRWCSWQHNTRKPSSLLFS